MPTEIVVTSPTALAHGGPSIVAMMAEWIDAMTTEGELAKQTAETYARRARAFMDWWQRPDVPTVADIKAWRGELLASNSRTTANGYVIALRQFLAWAGERYPGTPNPAASLKGLRIKGANKRHKRDPLTRDEARALLETCDGSGDAGRRDCALIALMLFGGLRTVEAHRANVGHLSTVLSRRVLRVQGKGEDAAQREVVLTAEAERRVRAWLAVHPDGGNPNAPLFVSQSPRSSGERLSLRGLRSVLRERFLAAGITDPRKTAHSLRHTAATLALEGGARLGSIQAMLGHASVTTTEIYARKADRMSDPAEDYIKL